MSIYNSLATQSYKESEGRDSRIPLGTSPELPLIFERTKSLIKKPDIAVPLTKTVCWMVNQIPLLPISSMFVKNIFGGQTGMEAFKSVMKKPLAGLQKQYKAGLIETGTMFFCAENIKKMFIKLGFSEDSARVTSYYAGAALGTIASYPFELGKIKIQLETKNSTVSKVSTIDKIKSKYVGVVPKMYRNMLTWGFGFAAGDYLHRKTKHFTGDSITGELAANVATWTLGSFIASPLLHIQMNMVKGVANSMFNTLKYMEVIPNQSLAGMPIVERSKILFSNLKNNGPQLWKGFSKAIPIIVLAALSNSGVKQVGKIVENLTDPNTNNS